MDPAAYDVRTSAANLLDVVAGRLADAVPALARIAADVERDWPDAQGRLWGERAALVRGVLVRELDAVLDLARLVGTAMQNGPLGGSEEARPPPVVSPAVGRRSGGPRLGGTDGQRVDDERGIRIAHLGEG